MKAALLIAVCLFGAALSETLADCPESCIENYDPVCGTDASTYSNECELRLKRCSTAGLENLLVAHFGECTEEDHNIMCPNACPKIYAPVCGTDLVTYGNLCSMSVVACQTKKVIGMRHAGECTEADMPTISCDMMCTEMYEPVCANDGKTYSNLCEMELASCRQKAHLAPVHPGACVTEPSACSTVFCEAGYTCVDEPKECFTSPCEQFRCVKIEEQICDQACTMIYSPVCGSDAIIYSNPCELEVSSCMSKLNGLTPVEAASFSVCPCLCNDEALKLGWDDLLKFDANKNNKIDETEYNAALAKLSLSQYELNSMFLHADGNQDGSIDAKEYSAFQGTTEADTTKEPSAPSAFSTGSLIAIVVGSVVGVAFVSMLTVIIVRSRMAKKSERLAYEPVYAEQDMTNSFANLS